jgi:2-polyprenyl-6-methoxyphenol hydroxylase-like FAD-dependent oxidoreductase
MTQERQKATQVLVVGAGPTGLVLALWLRRRGIDVRIIDKTAEPGTTSRALVVHARTLEFYRQLGIADDVLRNGLEFAAINLWVRGEPVARAELGDMGRGLSPFSYVVIFPQDEHERLLIEHLRRAGLEVERNTELMDLEDRGDRVVARLKRDDGVESTCEADYLAGCDGAHSRVRENLRIDFHGGTYERVFYVADAVLRGPVTNHELHLALDNADFLAVFPMKGDHRARLIGTLRPDAENRADHSWSDVSPAFASQMKLEVDRVNWFSTYRVHHRVARQFARGRVFLAGDAAHVHSPVGGQGMNTGIGDAVNLAWKLAAVLRRETAPNVLESYEPERSAFARRLVETTDRAFSFVTRDGPLARLVRLDVVPAVLPSLLRQDAVRRFMFRTVSQTLVHYRASQLSEGKAGRVRGGDRLPWTGSLPSGSADNFAALGSLDWQLHIYGDAPIELSRTCSTHRIPLHVFPWTEDMRKLGLERNAGYLVRPDGHVAFADAEASSAALERYLGARGIQFRLAGITASSPAAASP